jgi:hypothetical protein
MIDRILYLVGRKTTTSALPLNEIILDALNEAQVKIVRRCPQILEMQISDITSHNATTSQYRYSIALFNPGVAHLQRIWVLNGTSTQEVIFMEKDRFDRNYPAISSIDAGFPDYYTLRGQNVDFSCPFASDYNALDLRFDYCKWATPFASVSSTATSSILTADRGLMLWAESVAWDAIGIGNSILRQLAKVREADFKSWLNEFSNYHEMQTEELRPEISRRLLYSDDEE